MTTERIGRILRASTRGFDCGTHSRHIDERHDFGAFVYAPVANGKDIFALGLIYKVEIKDDQLISELVMGEAVPDAILRDQRNNRLIPVEVKILSVGYYSPQAGFVHSLPPRPPMSLADVYPCTPEQVKEFMQGYAGALRLDFFRIILSAAEVPSDDLLAATIRRTAALYESEAYDFIVSAGKRLARDLSHDMKRLAHLLALIEPVS
jgi:hypothetical protein